VSPRQYRARPLPDYLDKLQPGGLVVDVKCQADAAALREHGVSVWRL
jgi:UDP-N-acetyl-D-galactosamine dehydrogenase